MTFRLVSILMCMLASAGVSAQVYKSVDANGKIIYSDRPYDSSGQVSVIKASISVPVYARIEPVAQPSKATLASVAVIPSTISPEERSRLAALGVNERGEICARLVAENAKAGRAGTSAVALASK